MRLRILFVSSEYRPLLKIGGLADVAFELPQALVALGHEVRLLLPRIQGMVRGEPVARLPGVGELQRLDAGSGVQVLLLDSPGFARRHRLYQQDDGTPWPDDAACFDGLARMAAWIADDRAGLDWRPDVVHGHDWCCGLVPVRMLLQRVPAASVFSIHNLAHPGLFSPDTATGLGLPPWLMHHDALEYWGQLSFLKGGLMFADRLTTVSPRYAQEIQTPAFGEGLDGALRSRGAELDGILNGLDARAWNPWTDPALVKRFSARHPDGRAAAKAWLMQQFGLEDAAPEPPLAAMVTRLAGQKGVDLVLEALPQLLALGLRLVVLGSGETALESALIEAARRHPGRVAVRLGFDDALARRIYAGSDVFLMPSRFEPCGLSQMIALRYGSIPVVHATGGLLDTVRDAEACEAGNGFCFAPTSAAGLVETVARALVWYRDPLAWAILRERALRSRFPWHHSAEGYVQVYRQAIMQRRFRTD